MIILLYQAVIVSFLKLKSYENQFFSVRYIKSNSRAYLNSKIWVSHFRLNLQHSPPLSQIPLNKVSILWPSSNISFVLKICSSSGGSPWYKLLLLKLVWYLTSFYYNLDNSNVLEIQIFRTNLIAAKISQHVFTYTITTPGFFSSSRLLSTLSNTFRD